MDILKKSSISTSQNLKSKEEATILAGKLLVEGEYVTKEYIDSMLENDINKESVSEMIASGLLFQKIEFENKMWE